MDGLEAIEIKYSQLIDDKNKTKRIDSEYFKKEYIKGNELLNKTGQSLCSNFEVKGGKRLPLNESFSDSGIKYARAEDIKRYFLNIDNSPFISTKLHRDLKQYITKHGDVLLTIVGNSIGDVAKNELNDTVNLTENCVRVFSDYDKKNTFLFIFLLSKYGQQQIARETVGTAQPKLAIERIKDFLVPSFREEFCNLLYDVEKLSWSYLSKGKEKYFEANKTLTDVLDVQQINQISPVKAEKLFSDSFVKTGRLDAEYYQPKYDSLFETIERFSCKQLGGNNGIVTIKKSIEPGSDAYQDEGIPFVRVSDVSKFEVLEPELFLPDNIIDNTELLFPKKDTILFSKDGSVGIAYKVEEDMRIITSGALLHLTVRDTGAVLPDYLTLVLNSPIVQLQAERDANGAIIQHWKPSEIEKVVIPVLDMSIQRKISDKVQESFDLRHKSKELLEYAKQAVEMAIEQREDVALEWLKEKVGE